MTIIGDMSPNVKVTFRNKLLNTLTTYMRESKRAVLILEDGTQFEGKSFGYEASTSGEVVFNTAMTGYPESLTDPSYEGQILVTTYPILGNYGVPPRREKDSVSEYYESDHIHCRAIVAQDYSFDHSHWQADRSLGDWLKEEKIPGIYGIDTRALTKHLREKGSMLGKIIVDGCDDVEFYDPNRENLVGKVSTKEVHTFGDGDKTVVLVDCGTKHNIIRCLTRRGVKVVMVPWDYDFNTIPYDGLFISNGPGNPDMAEATVENIRKAIKTGTDQCFVTSQNHGFAVDQTTLPSDWEPLFINMNDGTNEGIRHKTLPFFSAQFHPEASSGPKDTEFIFDEFIALLGKDDNKNSDK